MAIQYENLPPEWQAQGVEPPDEMKQGSNGWTVGYRPPANYFNWLFNKAYKCMEELQAKLDITDDKIDSATKFVVIPLGETIPVEQRVEKTLYFQVTGTQTLTMATLRMSPTLGIRTEVDG